MVLLRSKWLHLYQIDSFVCRTDFQFVLKWFTTLTTFRSIKFCRWDLYTFCNTLAKLPALYKTLGVRSETSAKRPATAVEEYTKNKMSNTNRCHSNSFHIRHSRWAAKYSLKRKKKGTSNQQRWGKTTFIGTNSVSIGKYSPQWSEYIISTDEPVSVSWPSSCRLRAFPSLWRSPSHESKKICRKKLTSMTCGCSRNELHRRQFFFWDSCDGLRWKEGLLVIYFIYASNPARVAISRVSKNTCYRWSFPAYRTFHHPLFSRQVDSRD